MLGYVSLHTDRPQGQIDHEVSYAGYCRMAIEFDDIYFLRSQPITFPLIEKSSKKVGKFAAIGTAAHGQGEIIMVVEILPHLQLVDQPERRTRDFWANEGVPDDQIDQIIEKHGFTAPRVIFGNSDADKLHLPVDLNPIARTVHELVYSGLVSTGDLHPKIFEAVNAALKAAGVPILTVKRGAAAKMSTKLSTGLQNIMM